MGDDLMQHQLGGILSDCGFSEVGIYSDCEYFHVKNGLEDDSYLKADVIVIGGGGIIDPEFWVFSEGRIDKLLESGKKLVFLNVSVYQSILQQPEFVQKLTKMHGVWYVRDQKSRDLLKSVGIEARIVPDVLFSKPPQDLPPKDTRLMLVYPNYYAFDGHFNGTGNWDDTLMYFMSVKILAQFIDWMTTFGWRVSIVSAQTSQHVDDRIIASTIYGHVKNKDSVNWVDFPLEYTEHEDLISQAKLVVSMRYHSSAMAVKHSVPCIDIIHHDKNAGLWDDVGVYDNRVTIPFNMDNLIDAANASDKQSVTTLAYTKAAIGSWSEFNITS